MIFHATAKNEQGLSFRFTFLTQGWGKQFAEKDANNRLNEIVNADKLHQKYGPWTVHCIDIGD